MARVESFELDHNTVKAPYVRLAGTEQNGDALVEKYDLRFLQPNKDALPTGALHTLEVVPAVSAKECGNYKDHSLFAAKEYAKIVLDQGISLDPFERIL